MGATLLRGCAPIPLQTPSSASLELVHLVGRFHYRLRLYWAHVCCVYESPWWMHYDFVGCLNTCNLYIAFSHMCIRSCNLVSIVGGNGGRCCCGGQDPRMPFTPANAVNCSIQHIQLHRVAAAVHYTSKHHITAQDKKQAQKHTAVHTAVLATPAVEAGHGQRCTAHLCPTITSTPHGFNHCTEIIICISLFHGTNIHGVCCLARRQLLPHLLPQLQCQPQILLLMLEWKCRWVVPLNHDGALQGKHWACNCT